MLEFCCIEMSRSRFDRAPETIGRCGPQGNIRGAYMTMSEALGTTLQWK